MLDTGQYFTDKETDSCISEDEIWNDRDKLKRWFVQLFDGIQTSPKNKYAHRIDIYPYSISFHSKYYYALDVFAPVRLRESRARISIAQFENDFCREFLNYFFAQQDKAERFIWWLTNRIYKIPTMPENMFLDCVTPKSLSLFLQAQAKNDSSFDEKIGIWYIEIIPLFASILFSLQSRRLWSEMQNVLNYGGKQKLSRPFSFIEMFFQRYSEEEWRYKEVDREDVKTLLSTESGFQKYSLRLPESTVYAVLFPEWNTDGFLSAVEDGKLFKETSDGGGQGVGGVASASSEHEFWDTEEPFYFTSFIAEVIATLKPGESLRQVRSR